MQKKFFVEVHSFLLYEVTFNGCYEIIITNDGRYIQMIFIFKCFRFKQYFNELIVASVEKESIRTWTRYTNSMCSLFGLTHPKWLLLILLWNNNWYNDNHQSKNKTFSFFERYENIIIACTHLNFVASKAFIHFSK